MPGGETTITLWGQFRSPEMEHRFRQHHRREDIFQASVAFVVGIPMALLFISADIHFFGTTSAVFYRLVVVRVIGALACVVCLVLIRRLEPPAIDWLVFLWFAFAGSTGFYIAWTRPPNNITGVMLGGLLGLLMAYFVTPLPLPVQMLATGIGFCADAYLLVVHYGITDFVTRRAGLLVYSATYVMGAAVSWRLHCLNRERFAALERETTMRAQIEATLAEVRTLRGIVPICAHCKSVRTDTGYWQQVEVYLRENSEAQLTHGICPQCMKEHFGSEIRRAARVR